MLSRRALVLTIVLTSLSFAGCVDNPEPGPAGAPEEMPSAEPARTYTIGILHLADALVDVDRGFKEGLAERGYKEGVNVVFIERHAHGNFSLLAPFAEEIVAAGPDAVYAVTTPAVKAILAASPDADFPIVGTPVLNPVADGLAQSISAPGGRFTGASPLVDAAKQVEVFRETLGLEPRRIGIITSADHTEFLNRFKEAAEPAGFEVNMVVAKKAEEVVTAFEAIKGEIDALYIPPDNVVTNQAEYLIRETKAAKIPFMVPTEAMVHQGALVSYSADYHQLGKQTARMMHHVLADEMSPSTIPIEFPERIRLAVNLATAEEIGVSVPDGILARTTTVVR